MTTNNTGQSESPTQPLISHGSPLGPWKSLQRRRLLVLGLLLSLAAYMAGQTAGYPAITLAALVLFLCTAVIIRRTTGEVADKPADYLDERQVQVRNRSYLMAYRLTAATVAVAMLVVAAFGAAAIPKQVVLTVLSGMLFFSIVAPSCIVAWTEKEA
jgi:hypothetical protein